MTQHAGLLDELERDLGAHARLKVLANAGGQRRYIPVPKEVGKSGLINELGSEIAHWLSGRHGGTQVTFPSSFGANTSDRAARLTAAILDAGLTQPTRSIDDIAGEFGVSREHVRRQRKKLRAEADLPSRQLSLFDQNNRPNRS